MADRYVRSTDGDDADNGTTWALAKAKGTGAAAIDTAGDRIFFSQAHAETTSGNALMAWAGTAASPVMLLCGNDSAEPPTALATTAEIANTGTGSITMSGWLYAYGLNLVAGSGTTQASIFLASDAASVRQHYRDCTFKINNTNLASVITLGSSNSGPKAMLWENCQVSFAGFGGITVGDTDFRWSGGGAISGTTTPTLFQVGISGRSGSVLCEGVDFSNFASTLTFFSNNSLEGTHILRNCKLPASWSGTLIFAGTVPPGLRVEMYNCDNADTNYRLLIQDYTGSIASETTIVRTGGASDGTTPLAWRMATLSTTEHPLKVLRAPEIVIWNEDTGSAKTVEIEVVTDNVTLTDAEAWIEVQYLGTSGIPLSLFVADVRAHVLASPANQASSSEAWTTTGLTTPVKQKLSVTFTPEEKGFIHVVPCLAKASTTMYVCPKPTVT
jgi:hypothetical protein